jgi:hypothetical protein
LRPIDPKALKRKKRPLADGKETGVSARHPTKAVVLDREGRAAFRDAAFA